MTLLLGYPSRTEGTERHKPRPACEGRPEDFDLDSIAHKPKMIWNALSSCDSCPIRGLCNRITDEAVNRGKRPIGQVQAGMVWPSTYGTELTSGMRNELRRRNRLANTRRRTGA